MIESYTYCDEDFKVLLEFEEWKIGFLRYSERFAEFKQLERHLETDEAFVLLEGKATLYTEHDSVAMEKCVLYNVPKGEWHHIVLDEDTTVMVVENSDTCKENTEKRML